MYDIKDLKYLQRKFYDICDVAVNKRWKYQINENMRYSNENDKPYSITHIENDNIMLYRIYSKSEKDKYFEVILLKIIDDRK